MTVFTDRVDTGGKVPATRRSASAPEGMVRWRDRDQARRVGNDDGPGKARLRHPPRRDSEQALLTSVPRELLRKRLARQQP